MSLHEIILLAGLPFLMNGTERTLAAIVTFGQFLPALVWHGWTVLTSLFAGFMPH